MSDLKHKIGAIILNKLKVVLGPWCLAPLLTVKLTRLSVRTGLSLLCLYRAPLLYTLHHYTQWSTEYTHSSLY